MKNRLINAWKTLQSNRGSSVLLVIVAISCITLMTTSLLQLTYTAYRMKAAERQNRVEFYEADAKLDELVIALQNAVSDSVTEAHKEVLVNYSDTDRASIFRKAFSETLINKIRKNNRYYDADKLERLLDSTVSIADDSRSTYRVIGDNEEIILYNVRMTYKSPETGNETTVQADITIDARSLELDRIWDITKMVTYENWSTY